MSPSRTDILYGNARVKLRMEKPKKLTKTVIVYECCDSRLNEFVFVLKGENFFLYAFLSVFHDFIQRLAVCAGNVSKIVVQCANYPPFSLKSFCKCPIKVK